MHIGNMTEEEIKSMLSDVLGEDKTNIKKVKFPELEQGKEPGEKYDIGFLGDVVVELKVELGRSELTVRQILDLERGSVIQLDKVAGEKVDVFVNQQPFAYAEVVVINEAFGIRVNSFIEGSED